MKKMLIIFTIALFILPIKISAISITPKIDCETVSLKKGEKTECDFYLNVSDGKISAISASYSFDSNLSMIVVKNSENWQGTADGNQIDYYDYRDYTNHVPIAKITYKVKDDITLNENINSSLNIKVIEVADEYGNANILNSPVEVKFNLLKSTVIPTTTVINTTSSSTTKKTTTYKRNTTIKNSTTTSQQTTIKEISTTTKDDTTTIKKTTYDDVEKNNNKNPIIIASLLLFLILIIIAIIIIIKEEQKRKEI